MASICLLVHLLVPTGTTGTHHAFRGYSRISMHSIDTQHATFRSFNAPKFSYCNVAKVESIPRNFRNQELGLFRCAEAI